MKSLNIFKATKFKSVISIMLALIMAFGTMPMISVSAAQKSDYNDPADHWLKTNNRTNEFDINATIVYETTWCSVCNLETTCMKYRVPEYTRSGETALNRGVLWSDGASKEGDYFGNLDSGTPGVDAFYSGYHWTKSVCQICGSLNSINNHDAYGFNKNVYSLNACDNNFFLEFDNTEYEKYDEHQHTTTEKKGNYCQFCKGTYARATVKKEAHNLEVIVDAQLGNNRFFLEENCEDCGYETNEYVTAKSVVSAYYGNADGNAHTVTVSELSDADVHTSIRYGTQADKCNMTSAPNYTQAGYYPVYYEIDYQLENESMTENGVSYVLLIDSAEETSNTPTPHVHDYRYLETIKPTCTELGFERWQCLGCGNLVKQNYSQSLNHDYKSIVIREATCAKGGAELEICTLCSDFRERVTALANHTYEDEIVPATCKSAGYTKHICKDCGNSYITDITDVVNHSFNRIVKHADCENGGHTTYICLTCNISFVDDFTEPLGHNWDEGHNVTVSTCESDGVIEYTCEACDEKMIKSDSATGHNPGSAATCTEPQKCTACQTILELPKGHEYNEDIIQPTCTSMGYSLFTCQCGDTQVGNYTNMAEHNYIETVTAPTCTEHGFSTLNCLNCDAEYISAYTEKSDHKYTATVTEPTCTSMGFTTYVCSDCQEHYVSDYTDKRPHNYEGTVTEPTCLTLGYTTFVCKDCQQDTYKSEYKEALGHTPSEWIIDVEPTINSAGEKHIECIACGERLMAIALPQLLGRDFSNEDGNVVVGAYTIKLSDKNNMPIWNAEVTIDVNDNVLIKLPDGRLLDFSDPTIITASYTETGAAKESLAIHVIDKKSNNVTGKTGTDGILKVPNEKSSTTDDNGTIGNDNNGVVNTYVVSVTDKMNVIIPDCDIRIGESNNIVIDLPDGLKPTETNPVIVTAADQNGNAKYGVTVIALGDMDFIEKGITDIYGKLTLPTASEGYTDEDGKVNVDNINVIVKDEFGVISNAYVKHNEDNTISVTLPEEKSISYANRITVTVLDSMGKAIIDVNVTVSDIAEKSYTDNTDENGKIIVPPVNTDITDSEGKAKVNGYNVIITDETKPIENAYIEIIDGKITVKLPEGVTFNYNHRITATVTDMDSNPVKEMTVNISECIEADAEAKTLSGKTNAEGKVVFPPLNEDITDENGASGVTEEKPGEATDTDGDGTADTEGEPVVTTYVVKVNDTTGIITDAFIEIRDGKVYVTLPETHTLTTSNQTTVTVLDKDNKAVSGVLVTVKDKTTEKSATTNANGQVTVPVTTSSGGGGSSSPSYSGGGGGSYSMPSVNIKIIGRDGKIVTVSKSAGSDKATLTLPVGKNLAKDDNYYTITVTDKNGKAKADYEIILKDRNKNELSGKTDNNGVLILPCVEHKAYIKGYTDGTFRPDNDMTRGEAAAIFARLISEEKCEVISGKASFIDVSSKDWYSAYVGYIAKYGVIKGYNDKTFRADEKVTRAEFVAMAVRFYSLFNKVNNTGYTVNYTDLDKTHWAYGDIALAKNIGWLNGYADGTFKGDNNITRAEVVTVINRVTGREADKEFVNENLTKLNRFADLKNNTHWAFYDIIESSNNHFGVKNSSGESWTK